MALNFPFVLDISAFLVGQRGDNYFSGLSGAEFEARGSARMHCLRLDRAHDMRVSFPRSSTCDIRKSVTNFSIISPGNGTFILPCGRSS